jgi:hypothetical protein
MVSFESQPDIKGDPNLDASAGWRDAKERTRGD